MSMMRNFCFFVLPFFSLDLIAQHIYYGKVNEPNMTIHTQFSIMGDVDGATAIYVLDADKGNHTLHLYSDKMKLVKKLILSQVPAQHRVIGLYKIKHKGMFMVFHVSSDIQAKQQVCFATQLSFLDADFFETQTVESISYSGNEIIFKLQRSMSHKYAAVFVLGRKDAETVAISNSIYNEEGKQVTKTLHFFPMQEMSGESFENTLINDKGDFFFYTTLTNKYDKIVYANIFIQTLGQSDMKTHFINLEESKRYLQGIKPFYNSFNNSWNILGIYYDEKNNKFAQGVIVKSWQNDATALMITDTEVSFVQYLSSLKKRIAPTTLEGLAFNDQQIQNKDLLTLIKKLDENQEANQEENSEEAQEATKEQPTTAATDSISYIDDEEETLIARLQSLMELFSITRVDIVDIFVKSNGEFVMLLEHKDASTKSIALDKPRAFRPSFTFGLGASVGLGSSVGIEAPIGVGNYANEGNVQMDMKKLNNLTFLDFTPNGKFQWGVRINKKQSSRVGDNLSICTIKKQEKIYLYYVNEGVPSYIYSLSISPRGHVVDLPPVKGVASSYSIFPLMSEQTNGNSVILPSMYKGNLVFSRIKYD